MGGRVPGTSIQTHTQTNTHYHRMLRDKQEFLSKSQSQEEGEKKVTKKDVNDKYREVIEQHLGRSDSNNSSNSNNSNNNNNNMETNSRKTVTRTGKTSVESMEI